MIHNGSILKWSVHFIWPSKHRYKKIWKIITTILIIYLPQLSICPSNHALKIIMVVKIQLLKIVKVRIWATRVPIKNMGCLPIRKQYFDIISTYYWGYDYRECCIDQQRSFNGRIITTIYLLIICWINRCDCLYYMEIITSTLNSINCSGVCQGNLYCLTYIDVGSNRWPLSTTKSNYPDRVVMIHRPIITLAWINR